MIDCLTSALCMILVVLLCADIKDQHKILLRAHSRSMTGADYSYLVLHHLPPDYVSKPWMSGEHSPTLKEAYKAVLQVYMAQSHTIL